MSERYAKCFPCSGRHCLRCNGTGYSGDAMDYLESQNRFEREREQKAGGFSMERRSANHMDPAPKATPALNAAVHALTTHIHKQQKEKQIMTQLATVQTPNKEMTLAERFGFSDKQLDLIKRTVAKGATDDELELFFYRCKELQLNPLLPGQVYFQKYGDNPGTVVTGIDGARLKAHRTGQLRGIKRGVTRDANGNCTGAWADVYKAGCDIPFHDEVPLHEYNKGRAQWKTMPETMIKKVAEMSALRMAFPDELGGIYSQDEMDQAETKKGLKDVESEQVGGAQPTLDRPTEEQMKALWAIAAPFGKAVTRDLLTKHGASPASMTLTQYSKILAEFQALEEFAGGDENPMTASTGSM